jgi:hypothetical protein
MGASDTAAQRAAQQAAWDRLWKILLQPPAAPEKPSAPQPDERQE